LIVTVLGTRAEFLRCIPFLRRIEECGIDHHFLHTGQNNIDDIVKEFDMEFRSQSQLRSFRDVSTSVSRGAARTPALICEIRQFLRTVKPRWVVCHGDTLTAFATAQAANGLSCRVAHIEAGFRSHSLFEPFPEEAFRTFVDHRSDVLFAPSDGAAKNLRYERVSGEILHTGSTVPDVVEAALGKGERHVQEKGFVVVTAHRYENILSRSRLRKILKILTLPSMPIYYPVHEMTLASLKRFRMLHELESTGARIVPPLSYSEFMELLLNCNYVITDGGSIEEEALIFGKPCVLLRKRTERIEAVTIGSSHLTKLDVNIAADIIRKVEQGERRTPKPKNPYVVDGSATEHIAAYLTNA
jgi:UDP-N-acetylglucosamine 2-epimerase (non-hydrolysing)